MIIRPETAADEDAIHRITETAFAEASHASHTEADIIRQLRKDGDLTLSLVAEEDGEIVGHIAFSPVAIGGRHDDWYGLGPVAVRPDRQRRGIGSALVTQGLAALRARAARGCALLGDPAFYGRFGFESDGTITYRGLPVRYVQRLVFASEAPYGELTYAPAFDLAAL
ncbi:GCN5 family acetyltransferase [Methyloceanibacter methanicus]|uniref:GCN5 family acetyltransferase n=1 Tax=Methyloceanibacter methanicus TaxID=1774968 RepID=A0A1E3W7H7_9HYPH|nr:N-acetyltransferase [Methyloceanibacter methanicus]ODS01057.1 GCN5 family acetyltransferase [Methyloceanibacter methanicus]